MSIKQSESRSGLKSKLASRNLEFEDSELEEALKKYNYFNLFNGIESILLSKTNPKTFNKVKLDDFIAIYKFDLKLSSTILELLNKVEIRLKNSIAYHFSQKYCNTIQNTMGYTNKANYLNPKNRPNSVNYPFVNFQNKRIYNNFDEFVFFKPWYLTSLINGNDYIDLNFYSDINYDSRITNSPSYKIDDNNLNFSVAVPMWVAIETLTLGEVIRLMHYLNDDILESVMKDMNITQFNNLFHRTEFLNMLDFLLCLRNNCAHGSLVFRFVTPKSKKISSTLVPFFKLTPSETGTPSSCITLFDTSKILNHFESTRPLKKIVQKIIYRNNKHFKSPDFDLNDRLLRKMGEPSLSKWKEFLF